MTEKGWKCGMELEFEDRDYQLEENWLYVCVYPTTRGIRPHDYAEILSETERELRSEGFENLLLVPTREN